MKDFNIRPETARLLEENTEKKPHDTDVGNDFMDVTLVVQATITKTSGTTSN